MIEIPDSTFELVDEIYGLLLSLKAIPKGAGIPTEMKGPEIVAVLRGIANTTSVGLLTLNKIGGTLITY